MEQPPLRRVPLSRVRGGFVSAAGASAAAAPSSASSAAGGGGWVR